MFLTLLKTPPLGVTLWYSATCQKYQIASTPDASSPPPQDSPESLEFLEYLEYLESLEGLDYLERLEKLKTSFGFSLALH